MCGLVLTCPVEPERGIGILTSSFPTVQSGLSISNRKHEHDETRCNNTRPDPVHASVQIRIKVVRIFINSQKPDDKSQNAKAGSKEKGRAPRRPEIYMQPI